jgi:hypothetical protein
VLGASWQAFVKDFWACYYAVSPQEFDRLWWILMTKYHAAEEYLTAEIYPCRNRWAWAWIGYLFTAGVRTNGFVEVENRVFKSSGAGPKLSLKQVYDRLNE